ncbi:zinc finger protein 292 [Bufo bufo]|uniref:zinc finger protein 292 n=1 Tax=Bufo bufo TaxID=8384 RepID=UPI001ABD9D66|nr:zinc finger protein 292 [Bufo bufo]
MADGEAERESGLSSGPDVSTELPHLEKRLQELESNLRMVGGAGEDEALQAASDYCQRFCQTLLEYAEKWKASEDSLPLLEVYTVAIQSYSNARPYLTSQCENVSLVLERLALSCVELLLCLPQELPSDHWGRFQGAIKAAHTRLTENGSHELVLLYNMSQEDGVWRDPVLDAILNDQMQDPYQANEIFHSEGPLLLEMRIKRLLKLGRVAAATCLAKICSDHQEMSKKGHFKQLYLKCLCAASPNIKLIEEIGKVDCKDALEMICNLESEGDEKTSLILCAAFLSRQLQFGEMYCAWELTLFWSKLQRRVEPSIQVYLEICRQLSQLTKTVYHIFFLIKVIQSETEAAGLPTCIELCVRALRLESSDNAKVKISICKTISCLLPDDLEVKRACQLTEFLLEPTVDAYYAVEMLYNQPDQKYDEESLPVPNSLRCELLLVLKTRWPFDPEFWDWKTLKRQCLALMGEEASIVSSIDELNDNEAYDQLDDFQELTKDATENGLDCFTDPSPAPEVFEQKKKKKRIKKLQGGGSISARFRNWQAYMQYCVLCDKEFLGHRIIRHAQKHCIEGIYSCPICAKQYTTKETFIPHVTLHVKQSCKERLETMQPHKKLENLPKKPQTCKNKKPVTVKKQERQVKKNTLYSDDFIVFNDNDNSDENDGKDNQSENRQADKTAPVNEFPCPVQFCNKGFKYFKNLIAHVKGHKDSEEAARFLEIQSKKVVCQYCRRQFVSLTHLNDHLQMHCGSQPYICIQMKCKASFDTYADLLTHRKAHREFRAKCMFPKCGRIFSAAYMLFDHEAQHYNTFTCKVPGCGKVYHSELQLQQHLTEHSSSSPVPELDKSGNLPKMTKTVAGSKCVSVKGKSLQKSNANRNLTAPSPHSSDVPSSTKAKDPRMPGVSLLDQKADPVSSSELENSMHMLDQLLPSSSEVLPNSDLLSQVLPTNPVTQNTLPKADMLVHSTFQAESRDVKLPSLVEGFHTLLSENKLLTSADPAEEAQTILNSGLEEQCLSLFHNAKNSNQIQPSKSQSNAVNSTESKVEGDQQISNLMPFNVANQTAQLCENNLVMSGYGNSVKTENLMPLSLETSNALSNVLPPVSDATVTPVPPAPTERFKCNVEGCTRIYNSVQSIGKHMKGTHPEHYIAFKTERKNRKKQKPTLSDEKPTYCILLGPGGQNNSSFQSPLHVNPSFCNQLQHLPNPVFPTHLGNLVNPLSPVETDMSQGIPKNVSETLLGPEVGNLSNSNLTSQIDDLAKVLPMKFENGSDPFLPMPTENDPLPVMSSLSGNSMFSQLGGSSDHVLAASEANNFLKEDADPETFSKQVDGTDMDASFNLDKSSTMLSNSADKKNGAERTNKNKDRRSKHSPRAKCPAIIRDGKFICSRCFRVFDNPRSLGGHLSKRAVCKPHGDYDLSPVVSQKDSQPSMLASMILSSSPEKKAQSPSQSFSPEMTVKDEPFLSPIQSDNESTRYLHSGFIHPNISGYSPSENKISSPVKHSFETSENLSTKTLPPNINSDECITASHQMNMAESSTAVPTRVLQTSCSIEGGHSLENVAMNNCASRSKLSKVEQIKSGNVICPDVEANSFEGNNCISTPVSSTRVSVISGPQSSVSTTKKRSNSSKRKKKTEPPVAVEASHELAKNILAAVGGNLQMSTDMQPNFMAYGSDLLENLAKHLSSADKELFMACINESLKASSETHALCQLAGKQEKNDTLQYPAVTSDHKEVENLNVHMDFREKTFEPIPSDPTDVYAVNGNFQNIGSTLPQSQSSVSSSMDDDITGVTHSIHTSTNTVASPISKMNIPICSVSPTQETSVKYDEQVLEIMDLVQKLQIVDNVICEGVVTEEKCPPLEKLPIMSSVIVPNPSVSVVPEQTPDAPSQLGDKYNDKPFICQEEGCAYCAMTKDALFKHYTKVHYYTEEKLGEIKKHQLKFAPFRCVVPSCPKTFTRNSNLRAHCMSMHHFTSEQMVQLKIKRPYGKKSASESTELPPEMPSGSPEIKKMVEPFEIALGMTKAESMNQNTEVCQEVPTAQATEAPQVEEIKKEPSDLPSVESNSLTVDQKSKKRRRKPKEKEQRLKKAIEKDAKLIQGGSKTYKPYKCVHEGCPAAFTIQQNLMLHYQAFHKSDNSKFSLEDDLKEDSNGPIIKEFRCTEIDCSRIFSSFASLIQHYVKLHEMIAEEIENVISTSNIGQFNCDQSQCAATFTTCSQYIEHLEEVHDLKIKLSKVEGEEMYKCDCEGCDRVYATRSNLLRHIFLKHKDKHKEHLIRPRKISVHDQDTSDDKLPKEKPKVPKQKCENDDGPKAKKSKVRNGEKDPKSKTGPSTLKYGRHTYSLKDKEAALAECQNSHTKQYPCMIRGCTSIVATEHNMIRHYKSHKLSRPFVAKHKKALIVCKRIGRAKAKAVSQTPKLESAEDLEKPEVNKDPSDTTLPQQKQATPSLLESSDESSISTSQQSETEKDEMDELTELFISKLSNEDNTSSDSQTRTSPIAGSDFQESSSCQSEPQRPVNVVKRTNKQKHGTPNRKRKSDEHDEILAAETNSMLSGEDILVSDSCDETPAFDLSSFKPMGFEVSFLKFLEESVVKEKKPVENDHCKTDTQAAPQPTEKRPSLSVDEDFDSDIYLLFSNPSHLPNMDNVKIVLHEAFNDYIELVLKQLNELKPVVVLKRDICCSELPNVAKEQTID